MSRTRLAAALAAGVLATTLTGCGGGSESTSSQDPAEESTGTPTAAPSTGDEIKGTGFTFNAPDGWKQNDGSQLPSISFLAVALDPDDDDGFADNINVIEDPTIVGIDDPDKLGDSLEKVLGNVASDVSIDDPVTVDGEEAVVALATYPKYKTVQQVVDHDGKGYVITYSFSPELPVEEQLGLAASVASSWKWAS